MSAARSKILGWGIPRALTGSLALLCGATLAWAQAPAGSEFQVNQFSLDSQSYPDVAKAPGGSFVVVWENYQGIGRTQPRGTLDPTGIRGRRFDSDGAPLTGDLQVNQHPGSYFERPRIDSGGGEFVVTWSARLFGDSDDDPEGYGNSYTTIQMRQLDSSGSPVGAEFQVSNDLYTSYYEYHNDPDVSVDSAGNFVIVWDHRYSSKIGTTWRVLGRRFDNAGGPLGPPFDIDGPGSDFRGDPSVSHDPTTAGFVVVWHRGGIFAQPSSYTFGIVGRRYDSAGMPIGGEFMVNSSTGTYPAAPRVSHDSAGNFVVAWEEFAPNPQGEGLSSFDIFARRFDSGGSSLGMQFQVSQNSDENGRPDLCHDQCGGFVIAWEHGPYKSLQRDILGRSFDSSGMALTSETVVNSFTTNRQFHAGISHDLASNFVITWDSYTQDGSLEGVFGQRFQNSADLAVMITDMPDPVPAGMNITYDIPVSNAGAICSAATFSTGTPANTTFVSLSVPVAAGGPAGPGTGWSCTTPAPGGTGAISCNHPAFFIGGPGAFQLVVNVNGGTPGGTIINASAAVSGVVFDPDLNNNMAATTTMVAAPLQPDLTISKSVDPVGQVFSGDVLTYTIQVQNIGTGAATGVIVQDTVPALTSYLAGSCTAMPGSCSFADPVVSFNVGTLNPSQIATLTFQVVVDPGPLPPGQIVNNDYFVDSDQTDPVPGMPVVNVLVPAELIEFEAQRGQ